MTQAARGWPSGGQWGESGWTGLTPDLGPGGGDAGTRRSWVGWAGPALGVGAKWPRAPTPRGREGQSVGPVPVLRESERP